MFLQRHVKREQRIRFKSTELNRKKDRRTLTLALISLRSYSQYSIAKKQAVKKAFQDRQDSFIQ